MPVKVYQSPSLIIKGLRLSANQNLGEAGLKPRGSRGEEEVR